LRNGKPLTPENIEDIQKIKDQINNNRKEFAVWDSNISLII
jgi:hypothetical protein